MFEPRHILVPVALDPDESLMSAKRALEAACDIALKFGARITTLYLTPLLQSGDGSAIDVTGQVYQVLEETLKTRVARGREILKELEQCAADRGLQVQGRMIDSFDGTAHIVIKAADEIGADLLVLCLYEHEGLSQKLFGSLAGEIAHNTSVPVLLLQARTTKE